MVPTITGRLASVERALRDVVIPALPADAALAIEQAHLSLIQLGIALGQVDRYSEAERDEMVATVALAARLGAATPSVIADLDSDSLARARASRHAVLATIDDAITAAFEGAPHDRRATVLREVIAYHRARRAAEDGWVKFSFGSAA